VLGVLGVLVEGLWWVALFRKVTTVFPHCLVMTLLLWVVVAVGLLLLGVLGPVLAVLGHQVRATTVEPRVAVVLGLQVQGLTVGLAIVPLPFGLPLRALVSLMVGQRTSLVVVLGVLVRGAWAVGALSRLVMVWLTLAVVGVLELLVVRTRCLMVGVAEAVWFSSGMRCNPCTFLSPGR
jgi:hypothetical protein